MSLTLIVEQDVRPAQRHYADTLRAELVNENGFAKGVGVSTFRYELPLRQVSLNKGDSLHVTIRHVMSEEQLPGISDVGFTLKMKSDESASAVKRGESAEGVATGIDAQEDEQQQGEAPKR
jgi:hypothetical protein